MPTKRELVVGLIGLLIGAGAVVGGVKTDAVGLCAGVEKGVAVATQVMATRDAGAVAVTDAGAASADAGAAVDAGMPGADAGK
jgi:hypothetical protein